MTTTALGSDLDKVIGQIIKLTDRANHPDTPPEEAELCRAKAEEKLTRHNIEEEWIAKARPQERQMPILKRVPIYPYGDYTDVSTTFSQLFLVLARHCGVKIKQDYKREKIALDESETVDFTTFACVGYESDIRYLEVLFASLRLHVSANISPVWNVRESLAENVTRLHEVGVGYPAIADMAVKHGFTEFDRGERVSEHVPGRYVHDSRGRSRWKDSYSRYWYTNDKSVTAKLMRVYDKYCKSNGRTKQLVHSPASYRMWFLSGYVNMIRVRVNAMQEMKRSTIRRMDEESGGTGASLALRDRGEVVDEAFYNFFPELRPSEEPVTAAQTRYKPRGPGSRGGRSHYITVNYTAQSAGSNVARTADLSGGSNRLGGNGRKALG